MRAAPELYALRTTSGTALVWYGVTEEDTYIAGPGARAMKFPREGFGDQLSKGRAYREQAVYTRGSQYVAVIPKSPGQTKIRYARYAYLGVTGS
jgi:hypothetical protein